MTGAEPISGGLRRLLRVGARLLWQGLAVMGAFHCGVRWEPDEDVWRQWRAERALWAELDDVRRLLPDLVAAAPAAPRGAVR